MLEEPGSTESTAVQTLGLTFRFGRREVLNDLNLRVPQGGIYGLLGRNGAGKTTTLKLLMGMLKPRAGRITLLGSTVSRVTPPMRRRIGYVSQEQHFYGWMRIRDLADFVGGLYPTWDSRELDRLLELFRLEPGERVGELSTGSKMKLAMALALAHRPPLLVLDEPTAGVDPVTRREILRLLRREARERGRTAILSTHDIREIEAAADSIGILHGGAVRHQGPTSELERWFRRVAGPCPEGARLLFEDERGIVAHAEPEIWMGVVESAPASLDDIFFGLTRES